MIILQLFAALILLPLTVLLLLIFNAYLLNWIFWFAILAFIFIYAFFCGLLFLSASAAIFVFMLLSVCYNELNIQIPELIDVILKSCAGTQVHVAHDDVEFNFEIK